MAAIQLNGLSEREGAIDAVLRFVEGLDDNNEELVYSAFTEDASVDLRGLSNIGKEFHVLEGREKVASTLLQATGHIDTSHALSNFRVTVNGRQAKLTCYAQAQHFRAGEGPTPVTKEFLMCNRYQAEVVRGTEGVWRIQHIAIRCAWSSGDVGVLG